MSLVYWILILNLWILKAPALPEGSRTLLREIGGNNGAGGSSDPRVYVVDLDATNFDGVLDDTPATYAIVEIFAYWCPACGNYKPHYEKVARLFNGADAEYPDIILMTRVDCAYVFGFSIYTCKLQPKGNTVVKKKLEEFVSAAVWEPNEAKSEIRVIGDGRTAQRLLNWINKQIGSSYGLEGGKFEKKQYIFTQVLEISPTSFDIILEHKMIKWAPALLIKFHQLLVAPRASRK